jgi:hypothetical protein
MRFSKIFGIGLPRTGTTSLDIALNTLGISSIHFPFEIYERQNYSMISRYQALVDTPIPMFYRELDKLYPKSGFILTTRPVEDWLLSMEWLLTEGKRVWPWKKIYDRYNCEFFGSSDFKLELYENKFENFHHDVKEYFRGCDNLLTLNLLDGYGYQELCTFLEIPILDREYPQGNGARRADIFQLIASKFGQKHQKIEFVIRRFSHYQNRLMSKLRK